MKMVWQKLGRVYVASGEQPWARTHAYLPTVRVLDDERIRVYAALLDQTGVGRIGYVDVAVQDPVRILRVSRDPVLDVGAPGTFDDSGVSPLSVVDHGGRIYLYYAGWQRGLNVRYSLFVGLAVSEDGGETFRRYSSVPVLDRSDEGVYVRSGACVRLEEGVWQMWYMAGSCWIPVQGKQTPTYNMRYLESRTGVDWGKSGVVCLEPVAPDEFGFGRPAVRKEGGRYQMWYSVRTLSKGYRLGYAESADGRAWRRLDHEVGLDISNQGWDSQMVSCGTLAEVGGTCYLFYNGNNYGETGFGVAVGREEG